MTDKKRKLTRPRTGRILSGVCAGLAIFFGLDVSLVRIVYTFATVFTAFAGVIIYINVSSTNSEKCKLCV